MHSGDDGYSVLETASMNTYDFGSGLEQVLADYLVENLADAQFKDEQISRVATN